ncbi:putative serine threonine-protein kinase psk1 [Erysiphe necator]|uniref:Putative serine threonine-protein kinase psk1 n=1 Tax=Uncinula necator TaxID=52586 RepID=A0A0B1P764_UNCNE|nr:putative serine threonine-protein kinase psk1 [Erysiphe necator]
MTSSIPALNILEDTKTPKVSYKDLGLKSKSSKKRHKIDDVVSSNSSPSLRPTQYSGLGGISKLRLKLEEINLNGQSSKLASGNARNTADQLSKFSSGVTTCTTSEIEFSDDDEDDRASDISNCNVPPNDNKENTNCVIQDSEIFAAEEATKQKCNNQIRPSDFQSIRCLGKGTFGIVHLVKQHTTGRLYAQKQFKKASLTLHERLIQQTKTERTILESVKRHPFVVKLFYAFQDDEKLYLILEYAQGGELFTQLAKARMFPEPVAVFYLAEMVLALDYLHHHLGVIYRDLKPENCLLDSEGHLLLTDFGLSKVIIGENDRFNSVLGTVEYMAPEIILGHRYGKTVDWWSFGALGFDLLTGSPPFKGQNQMKVQERIVKQKLQLPHYLSPDAKDLITRLLRKEPSKRLGANMPKDISTIKKHRFFRKIDWKLLEKRQVLPPIRPVITDPELAENFATEFTSLPISPMISRDTQWNKEKTSSISISQEKPIENPFGGFSYIASPSLLEGSFGGGQFAGLGNEVEA